MIHTKDHKSGYIFDPWDYLGPKRRKLIENSWAGIFRKEILNELPVDLIAEAFSEDFGRPTKELYTALGTLILQQMHDLTDEDTVTQLACNLQWHYGLDIPGESDEAKYLSPRTLFNIRKLVTERGLDEVLFQRVTDKLAETFKVDTQKQRMDSVHIRSNMRRLGRMGVIVRTIHKFLINLKRQHPEILETLDQELVGRYLTVKSLSCFSMVKPSESEKTLKSVGDDLLALVQSLGDHPEVVSMSSFGLLERVLKEQYTIKAEGEPVELEIKAAGEIAPDSLQNPSDPQAGYDAHKGQGYQAQMMETYSEQEEGLSLITHVEVEPAQVHDAHALIPAIEKVEERDLKPEQILADSAYGSEENLQKAQEMGVEVIAPAMGSYQKEVPLSDFTFNSRGEVERCPQNREPVKTKRKKERFQAAFASETCRLCPFAGQCPVKAGKKYHYLRYSLKNISLAQRRAYEKTEGFKNRYRFRSGIEGAFSALDRKTGLKNLRVRGLKAVRFCVNLKAAAMNILRAAAFKLRELAPKTTPETASPGFHDLFLIFKERWRRFFHLPGNFPCLWADGYTFNLKSAA